MQSVLNSDSVRVGHTKGTNALMLINNAVVTLDDSFHADHIRASCCTYRSSLSSPRFDLQTEILAQFYHSAKFGKPGN